MVLFKPTARLCARTEARVKGFRAPAIKILRDGIQQTSEIELPGVLKQGQSSKREQSAEANAALARAAPKISTAGLDKRHVIQIEKSRRHGWSLLRPSKRSRALDWTPPASTPWKHVAYAYNKNTTKNLPLVTSQVRKLAQAYLNMWPKDLDKPNTDLPGGRKEAIPQAFVSGHHGVDQPIRQDLLGKVTINQKSFMIPYRTLLDMDPQVLLRHRTDSVNVSLHVYDERLFPAAAKRNRSGRGVQR